MFSVQPVYLHDITIAAENGVIQNEKNTFSDVKIIHIHVGFEAITEVAMKNYV
jgi:hypothetical protein